MDRVNRQFRPQQPNQLWGPYKAELIHRRAPWKTKEAVESGTLERVSWFNHHRLLDPNGYIPCAARSKNRSLGMHF